MRKNSVPPGLGGGDGLKMVARQLARGPRQQNEGLNALFDYGFIAGGFVSQLGKFLLDAFAYLFGVSRHVNAL